MSRVNLTKGCRLSPEAMPGLLFKKWLYLEQPTADLFNPRRKSVVRFCYANQMVGQDRELRGGERVSSCLPGSWILPFSSVVLVNRNAELPHPARACSPPPRLTGRLNRRQQEARQDADNCNDRQQFNQTETAGLSCLAARLIAIHPETSASPALSA